MKPTSDLLSLPGLGPASVAMLATVGIGDAAALRALGSVEAYLRVSRTKTKAANLNLLWALEGALTGHDWRRVARDERTRLLLALDDAQRASQAIQPIRTGPRSGGRS